MKKFLAAIGRAFGIAILAAGLMIGGSVVVAQTSNPATRAWVTANYCALTGCTFTGPIATSGAITSASINFGGSTLSTYVTGAWTPTDQSGAGLTFTSVSGSYIQIGNIVCVQATLTFPNTANGSAIAISAPVAVPNQTYAHSAILPMTSFGNAGIATFGAPIANTSTIGVYSSSANAPLSNSSLSLKPMSINGCYSAT